ncbi:hypothetical protein D1007_49053 [Hordeum vulgare]|nr:hypothetical protein D1007_49053 [Hordeum vulgare]
MTAGPVGREGPSGAAAAARSARPPAGKMGKVSGVKRKKVPTNKPSSTPSAPARRSSTVPSYGAASTTREVFNERTGSGGLNNVVAEFMNLLATNAVDIDQASIVGFEYNELEGGVDGHGGEDEVEEYPFLHLIGPSRAIVAGEPVLFQIELKLKCGAQFEDKASFTANQNYHPVMRYHDTMEIRNCCCTAKIRLGRVSPAIQATIVGVRVVEGEWPFKYGCKVSCLFSPADATEGRAEEVVLLDYHAKRMCAGSDGCLSLSRNVVSVAKQGTLRVIVGAYSKSGLNKNREFHAEFRIQESQTDSCRCSVDGSTLEIVVAWSRIVMDKSKRGNVMEKRSKSLYVINLLGGNIDRIITELRSTAAHPHTPTPTTTTHPEPY